MDKIYVVRYCRFDHDIDIFATSKKSKATRYVTRFNRILKEWKDHYKKYEIEKYPGLKWISDEYIDRYYSRWNMLRDINRCYWVEVEIR